MVTFGRQHCVFLKNSANGFDPRLVATYYDAQWVYQQIKEYTRSVEWESCAQAAEAVYRDLYSVPNNGYVPGYWNFTRGLTRDFLQLSDLASKNAALSLSLNAAYARDNTALAETQSFLLSREVSYAISSYLDAELLGQPRRARLATLVDHQLGHFDQWFVSRPPSVYVKPFMVGLAGSALIDYHAVTADPRILPTVRRAADWMFATLWRPEAQAFLYIEKAVTGEDPPNPAPDLNQLIAPMYAWLWEQTRDPMYRTQADQIFAGGVAGAYLVNAKQFNQNYRRSIETVRRRNR